MENNIGKVSFNSPSLKNLLIGTSNVEHTPTSAFVIECRDVPKRNDKNEVIAGTISKKVLLALQPEIVKAIQEVGGDLSSIKPFTVEIYNDESFLKKINNELIKGMHGGKTFTPKKAEGDDLHIGKEIFSKTILTNYKSEIIDFSQFKPLLDNISNLSNNYSEYTKDKIQ